SPQFDRTASLPTSARDLERPAGTETRSQVAVERTDFRPEEREKIARVQHHVMVASSAHDLDPALINGVIWVESRFEPRAKSPAGARGLMQLMPATASALAIRMGRHRATTYDPEFNIMAGSLYLAE